LLVLFSMRRKRLRVWLYSWVLAKEPEKVGWAGDSADRMVVVFRVAFRVAGCAVWSRLKTCPRFSGAVGSRGWAFRASAFDHVETTEDACSQRTRAPEWTADFRGFWGVSSPERGLPCAVRLRLCPSHRSAASDGGCTKEQKRAEDRGVTSRFALASLDLDGVTDRRFTVDSGVIRT
jgi:hypothetical protein